ncbi:MULTISPECIES: DUF3221 domain-containing protein [Bacillus amyloliquefaciens group]|uniref:DUF3221 domain-containing protein n=1 Tax=Bacillus amyloliquefaciens group TaxID=1938374 RepID=UPI00070F932A|nr:MULTISPECIES: DUF3221 domain-containing protein [Bacillus amyloliquefaciens group]MCX2885896.1 DUF3221 domain-containing protein [Bacillus velezensis]MED0780865.1 DUF3221 domain-containing protein [Bacillus siamensis]MED0836106.1 DUF3221 domain-containing protein [Bacillus siamensis]GJI61731.1 hypothetical protein BVSY1_08870 [Bacillus velezensis]
MYRVFLMLSILLCVTLGCQNQHSKNLAEEEQTMVGYVIFKGENQAIFIPNEKANVKDYENLNAKEIIERYRSDIILLGLSQLDNKNDLKKGQKVRIWYKKLNESSPPKTTISKFERIQ